MIPSTLFSFLWYFVKKQKFSFSILLLCGFIWAINETLFPYFLKSIINNVNQYSGDKAEIYTVLATPLLAMLCMWLLMEIAMRLQGMLMIYVLPKFRASIRETVYKYVKSHSHSYFANNFAGSIADKISDLPTSCQSLLEILIFNFISIGVALTVSMILMWQASPIFTAIMFSWLAVHISLTILYLKKGNKLANIHAESVTTLSGKIVDSITNISNVRLFARSEHENHYLKKYQNIEISNAHHALWHLEKLKIFLGLASLAFMIAVIWLLICGWQHDWVTIGDFSLIAMLSFGALGLLWYMSYQITVYVREAGRINAALRLIAVDHEIVDTLGAQPLVVKRGEINYCNVKFSYNKAKPIFANINVNIPPGQKIGLVGVSGSGKSTFVNILLRLFDIEEGTITIDNQSVSAVTGESLREAVAMIPQDPTLFHRSLLENIRYAKLSATDEEVLAASKAGHCHEFVKQTEQGYDSLVGERGIKLSGGQRQRIAIARAILKNAPILILDEATSSLDSVTEKLIQQSLDSLMKNRTTIVIAHRLSTLANMDRILVFNKGEIVEDNTMVELLKNPNGEFRKLWTMQADGFIHSKGK